MVAKIPVWVPHEDRRRMLSWAGFVRFIAEKSQPLSILYPAPVLSYISEHQVNVEDLGVPAIGYVDTVGRTVVVVCLERPLSASEAQSVCRRRIGVTYEPHLPPWASPPKQKKGPPAGDREAEKENDEEKISTPSKKRKPSRLLRVMLAQVYRRGSGGELFWLRGSELIPTNSGTYRASMARKVYDATGQTPSHQQISTAQLVVEGGVHPPTAAPLRVAELENTWLVDGHTHTLIISFGKGARWEVGSPLAWRRPPGQLPIRPPTDLVPDPLGQLRTLLAVDDAAWHTMLAWLLGALMPSGPYPILAFTGETGAGKTVRATLLRQLVDPHEGGKLRLARDDDRTFLQAHVNRVLCYDNITKVDQNTSDTLCMLATGGTIQKKTLYTDVDTTTVTVERPVILTGLADYVMAQDLLRRCLLVEVRKPARVMPETELLKKIDRIRGAVLQTLGEAIAHARPDTVRTEEGMVGAARLAIACAPALGVDPDEMRQVWIRSRDSAHQVASADELLVGLLSVIPPGITEITPKQVLTALRAGSPTPPPWLPSGNTLWRRIRALAPVLRGHGIEVTRTGGKYPVYCFSRSEPEGMETQNHEPGCTTLERGLA